MRTRVTSLLVTLSLLGLSGCSGVSSQNAEFCSKAAEMYAAFDNFDGEVYPDADMQKLEDKVRHELDFRELDAPDDVAKELEAQLHVIKTIPPMVKNADTFLEKLEEAGKAAPADGKKLYREAKASIHELREVTSYGVEVMDWVLENLDDLDAEEFTRRPPRDFPQPSFARDRDFGQALDPLGSSAAIMDFYLYTARTCPRK